MEDKIIDTLYTFLFGIAILSLLSFAGVILYLICLAFRENAITVTCVILCAYIVGYIGRKIGGSK